MYFCASKQCRMTVSNAEIKKVRSLREKKFRDETRLFVVEGEKMVREALGSGWDVVSVYRRETVGEEAMERMSSLSSPSPVLAVVRQKETEGFRGPRPGLCLALDAIRDPGNLGTIIRLADWFGVDTIFASPDTVELYNPKVIQSSMGSVFRKNVIYCDLTQVCRSYREAGRKVCGTFLGGSDIYRADLDGDALVVMGNEANGISGPVGALADMRLTIPCFAPDGAAPESLNVAVATAVVMSEFRRR